MPRLATVLKSAQRRADETVVRSRDGAPVNGLIREGRPVLFHSRYAAYREAERMAEGIGDAGFAVALGVGMAHHLRALLRRGVSVLAVEPDAALLRAAMEEVDISGLLASPLFSLATCGAAPALADEVSRRYDPVLHRGLTTIDLPGRAAAEPERTNALRQNLITAIESVKADLATQSRLGRLWMRNTVLNAPRATFRPLPHWRGLTVVVAAAGPSLKQAAPHLRERADVPLLAVDTAFPVLTAHGVRPDLVLTVDCQLASYHHFLTASQRGIPTVAELAVTPSLFARQRTTLPVLSHHPLHELLRVHGLALPHLDVRGGNVTEAAVHLAAQAGASRIVLVGADYAYPNGETYPAGSYVHSLFAARATRVTPAATLHTQFLYDRPGVSRDPQARCRWVQPLLEHYARGIEGLAPHLPARLERLQLDGIAVALPSVDDWPELLWASRTATGARRTGASSARSERLDLSESATSITSGRAAAALQGARAAIEGVRSAALYREALAAGGTESLGAFALRPLLLHLRATDPDAVPDDLIRKAVQESLLLFDQVL